MGRLDARRHAHEQLDQGGMERFGVAACDLEGRHLVRQHQLGFQVITLRENDERLGAVGTAAALGNVRIPQPNLLAARVATDLEVRFALVAQHENGRGNAKVVRQGTVNVLDLFQGEYIQEAHHDGDGIRLGQLLRKRRILARIPRNNFKIYQKITDGQLSLRLGGESAQELFGQLGVN